MQGPDLLSALRGLPKDRILLALEGMSDEEVAAILFDWPLWARPNQLEPVRAWRTWLLLAGRGFGKTRTGAELTRAAKEKYGRIALVGPTAGDARDVMVEGESGILACAPNWDRPEYEPSKRRVTWRNGAIATVYSADEPDRMRGPQHEFAWCDELAAWRHMQDAWDNLQMGLRLGPDPKALVTTTPRPLPLIKELLADPTTAVTRGSTYDNTANLAPSALDYFRKKYEGTRLGRQELNAEILLDTPGALWTQALIEAARVRSHPDLIRIVVGCDPSVSDGKDTGSETGVVVVGIGPCMCKGTEELHGFVLDDPSQGGTPTERFGAAVTAFHKFRADRVIGEVNNGGDLVEFTISTIDADVPVKSVRASRGKRTRAEPISSLYEQGRIHHVGLFGPLEDQMTTWVPGQKSPDRMDALVWAITELAFGGDEPQSGSVEYEDRAEISAI